MFGKNKTPLFAARFLALAAISAVSADAGSQWVYSEDRTAQRVCHPLSFEQETRLSWLFAFTVFPDRLKNPAYLEVFDPQNNVPQRIS